MTKPLTLIPFFGLLFLIGCDSQPPKGPAQGPVAVENAKVNKEDLPVVERAEYANWNRFPEGTVVKHVRETKNDAGKVFVTTTSKLVSKSNEKVVIETQITVDRGGELLVNPSMELEYPASFRLPPNMDAAKFALPAQDAKLESEESIEFQGKEYAAKVYTWDAASESGKTKNKMWLCNDIPGRVFRHEMTCSTFTTAESIAEIEIPKT
jgi:hypothetical protein